MKKEIALATLVMISPVSCVAAEKAVKPTAPVVEQPAPTASIVEKRLAALTPMIDEALKAVQATQLWKDYIDIKQQHDEASKRVEATEEWKTLQMRVRERTYLQQLLKEEGESQTQTNSQLKREFNSETKLERVEK